MKGGTSCYTWGYELRPRNPRLGDTRRHRGVLLRVGGGFACLHPWPELGDAPLDEQLRILRDGGRSALIDCALECARADAEARAAGVSLFENLRVPESHALVGAGGSKEIESALEEGFQRIKIKCGSDPRQEAARVRGSLEILAGNPEAKLRLDFNEGLSAAGFGDFLADLPAEAARRIDFVEDPFAYEGTGWERARAGGSPPLALDRSLARAAGGFEVAVLKPALDDILSLQGDAGLLGVRWVVTSYLDHPFGQSHAAYRAGRLAREREIDICGLSCHSFFELDAFSEAGGEEGPRFVPPAGTGLGYDELLEKLPWKRLD
ncbi:MAG: enolase C-terminal domain-like protein [Verrucomicrobiales bacterium]